MHWAGSLLRMDSSRLPKRAVYGEVSAGKRPRYKPRKCFKYCNKAFGISFDTWELEGESRPSYRTTVHQGCKQLEKDKMKHAKVERNLPKGNLEAPCPKLTLQRFSGSSGEYTLCSEACLLVDFTLNRFPSLI